MDGHERLPGSAIRGEPCDLRATSQKERAATEADAPIP